MVFRHTSVGSVLLFALTQGSFAQSGPGVVSLPAVPATQCDGKAGSGAATFSTSWPKETGTQINIYSDGNKGYASQKGAQWKIWSDTPGVKFPGIGVPGAGAGFGGGSDPATNLKKLLSINSDGHSTTFNITDDPDLFNRQILLSVTPPGATNLTKRRNKMLRARSAPPTTASAAAGSFDLTATATWPCSLAPGAPTSLSVDPASNTVATACKGNQISNSPDSWKQYGVDSYLTSLIAQETSKPDHPNLPIGGIPGGPIKDRALDIGNTIKNDAAAPNLCTVSDKCDYITCDSVRGSTPVDKSDPARMLAYNAYANLSNLLYEFWRAIKFANIAELNEQDKFVSVFFEGTPPAVTWKEIVGATNPALYLLSGLLGFVKSIAVPAAVIGLIPIIMGEITASDTASHHVPTLEEKWEKSADLGAAIQGYVTNMTSTVEGMHTGLIDHVYGPTYLNVSSGGAMLGDFKTDEAGYSSGIIEQVSALFYMKAIDWVMKQNSVFIIWMPYGVPTKILAGSGGSNNEKTVHDWPNFSQSDCEKDLQGGDNGTIFTVCDAGGETKGMARIFQISKEKNNAYTSAIQGWDSALEIPGGWKFDLPTVMRGAVNSWQTGGFNYNLDNTPKDDLPKLLQDMDDTPDRAGVWTVPVCCPASYYGGPPAHPYSSTSNQLGPFLDATKDVKMIGARGFFDCWMGLQYKNATTGEKPDWFGGMFADSGLPDNLKKVVSP